MQLNRPAVSRDTRQLLAIVLIALAVLWVFARIRFPNRAPTANPVPPVLAQLAPASAFDNIVGAMAQLEPRVRTAIVALEVEHRTATRASMPAYRFRDDLALVLTEGDAGGESLEPTVVGAGRLARDRASALTVVRVPGSSPAPAVWTPQRPPSAPRFLVAATASARGTSLRPVFVGSLREALSPIWPGVIWNLPPETGLAAGTLMFTVDGAFAGLVVTHDGHFALVPARSVIEMAERLVRADTRPEGRLGVEVVPLTPATAAATGANAGMLVTWVDPDGPAANQLTVTDVIEAVDDTSIATPDHWRARVARLAEGETVVVSVRRGTLVRTARITAGAVAANPTDPRPIGLTLRSAPRLGAEVIRVEPQSAAFRAGLQAGDVITVVGDLERPTAAAASRALAAGGVDRPVVIGITRAGRHHVLALDRKW